MDTFSKKFIENFDEDVDDHVSEADSSENEFEKERQKNKELEKEFERENIKIKTTEEFEEEELSSENTNEQENENENNETNKTNEIETEDKKQICEWNTTKGRCKKYNVSSSKFCEYHRQIRKQFKKVVKKKKEQIQCSTQDDIKIIPRSREHLIHMMSKLKIREKYIDVYIKNNTMTYDTLEEADFSNEDYLELTSDKTKFYYNNQRGKSKAKDLRVYFRKYCHNDAFVCVNGVYYCLDCYHDHFEKKLFPTVDTLNFQ